MTTFLVDVTADLSACGGDKLNLCLLGYQLELATSFGTSHSTSSCRNNALILLRAPLTCTVNSSHSSVDKQWVLKGVGEVGLPPKKALVYEADLGDIQTFLLSFIDTLQKLSSTHSPETPPADVFATIPEYYFSWARRCVATGSSSSFFPYVYMLRALDTCSCHAATFARAGRALIESAVMDAWAKDLQLPLYKFLGVPNVAADHNSFYTAALNDDISLIVAAALFGAKHTPHLKIKLNHSVDQAKEILFALNKALPHKEGNRWCIDANAAWTPSLAEVMLQEVLEPYSYRIFMVEQPFPVDVVGTIGESSSQWIDVKEQYNARGILIFADESMRTADDVALLAPLVNGVNIKLEKCGGPRGAVLAAEEAKRLGVRVWLGCMVGSNINSTTTAHLSSLACGSDLDGALLVTQDSQIFSGGFQYTSSGSIKLQSEVEEERGYGIGVVPKSEFASVVVGCASFAAAR